MNTMKRWIWLIFLLTLPVHAQWITTSGSAPIINGDSDEARVQATQDALRQAMLQAGASVSSIQNLTNGALTRDQFQVRANSEIRQYNLLQEERHDGRLTVTLRAFIVADRTHCAGASYAKGITLIRFRFANPEQASYGQLYDLHRELTRQIFSRLGRLSQNFVTRRWLDANLGLDPRRLEQGENGYVGQMQSLAAETDSQYLLFGVLEDISLRDASGNLLDQWLNDPIRHFTLQLYLFDGLSGELIDQPHYETEAPWGFAKQEIVDVTSQKFWSSAYGEEITAQLNRAVQDMQMKLQCTNPVARIVRIDGDNYHINLGKRHGIKVGERFYIEQKANFTDGYGRERTVRNPATGQMEVKRVYDNNAIMMPLNRYAAGNIQINDLAVLE
jgi:hypothetical protein